ncbi:hypothetical protein IB238_03940 [Rhizobium sp. ARZ01]|uniref:hypothetical protein n=1 Tax=Rhizobium sp. ARZ01 TaxID=2769313 RepID=UPI001781E119|nr:hypothetical protein [Rhizobium sp. ARZ01]MBD9371792.1 hypothetical protein [Rhizobium sp. ARZ01]
MNDVVAERFNRRHELARFRQCASLVVETHTSAIAILETTGGKLGIAGKDLPKMFGIERDFDRVVKQAVHPDKDETQIGK